MTLQPNDTTVLIVRLLGTCISALAGIAALLTDGAFVKREPAPTGRWADFPFVRYRVSAWGVILLAIIVLAPSVQFVSDRLKDKADATSQATTAKKIETDVGTSITMATNKSEAEIVVSAEKNQQAIQDTFAAADRKQRESSNVILGQETVIGARTESILTQTERALEPLRGLMFSAEIVLPGDNEDVKQFTDSLDRAVEKLKPTVVPFSSESKEGLTFFFRDATHVDAIEVGPHSIHYPGIGSEPLSDAIDYGFGIAFDEPPLTPADQRATLSAPVNLREGRRLVYRLDTHQLIVEYSRSISNPKYWNKTPNFVSVADIRRSLITFCVQTNIDKTSDRNKRSLAILQDARFKSFGFETPDGLKYWSERIYRLQSNDFGIPVFGGPFDKLFDSQGRELLFAGLSNPALEVQDNLEATVVKFERYLTRLGIAPTRGYKVRIGSGDSDFSEGGVENGWDVITIPPDPSAMLMNLLFLVSSTSIRTDTDLSEQLSTYLVCDFLGTPQLTLAGKKVDISSAGPRSGETYQQLTSALWEIRRAVGAKSANGLVAGALAKFRANIGSNDPLRTFANLLMHDANPVSARQVSHALHQYDLL